MSLSNAKREGNIPEALHLMMQDLDQPFDWQEHDSTDEKFATIHRATWSELTDRGFVRATTFDRYILTRVQGEAGRLSRALKSRVKGRREPGFADRDDIARQTGLNEYFVYDAIDSHLLRELFNQIDAYRAPDDAMKNMIEIPAGFGLPLLS